MMLKSGRCRAIQSASVHLVDSRLLMAEKNHHFSNVFKMIKYELSFHDDLTCKTSQTINLIKHIILCYMSPGAQSDSELSSHHLSEVTLDRGYTSDSEVYTEHKTRIPRSTTDVDVASSGWLVVSTQQHIC